MLLPQEHKNQLSLFYTTGKWLMNLPHLGFFWLKSYFSLLLHSPSGQEGSRAQPSCPDRLRGEVGASVPQPSPNSCALGCPAPGSPADVQLLGLSHGAAGLEKGFISFSSNLFPFILNSSLCK